MHNQILPTTVGMLKPFRIYWRRLGTGWHRMSAASLYDACMITKDLAGQHKNPYLRTPDGRWFIPVGNGFAERSPSVLDINRIHDSAMRNAKARGASA